MDDAKICYGVFIPLYSQNKHILEEIEVMEYYHFLDVEISDIDQRKIDMEEAEKEIEKFLST